MSSIDADAYRIGIDPKIWKEFRMRNWKEERGTQWRGLPKERELPKMRELPKERLLPPARLVQGEFGSIVNPIDDREAFIRRKQALAQRWFGYYKKCKSKRNTIIDQYNRIALMRGKDR